MIRDSRAALPRFEGAFDCCILGAGPAGITLALTLARAGRRVLLLEGGDRDFTDESQELYQADVVGRDYNPVESTRLRYLGGSTGHWGGQCLMLDPFDFTARDDVPLSGWPIGFQDLMPYRSEAARLLQTGDFGETLRRPLDGSGLLDEVEERWSADRAFYDILNHEPVRFGTRYAAALAAEPGIELVLNANATGFDIDPASGRVLAVQVRNHGEDTAAYGATDIVMAMGGIENARMLLHLNQAQGDRFGNQGGMVGRCFMDHPALYHGVYFITRRLYSPSRWWGFERFVRRATLDLIASPTAAMARQNGWLNASIRFNRPVRAPLRAAQAAAPFVRDLVYDRDYFHTGVVWVMGEQAPNPDSRITLSDQRDRFGLQRAALDWRLQKIDFDTLRGVSVEGAKWLMRTGLGRMQMEPHLWQGDYASPDLPVEISFHHMGGARMAATAKTGVVDADCRVHGATNLYVAGSGVFATSGHANPTFTIVQLALRLADHLIGKSA